MPKKPPPTNSKKHRASNKTILPTLPSAPVRTVEVFVRHPPSGKSIPIEELHTLPNPYITTSDLDAYKSMNLLLGLSRWRKTRRYDMALMLYVMLHEYGLYPPLDLQNWLVEGLKPHLVRGVTIEHALGLREPPRVAFRKNDAEDRDHVLCEQMYLLKYLFHISIDQAAEMVAVRDKDRRFNTAKMLSAAQIARRFSSDKSWKQHLATQEKALRWIADSWSWVDEQRYLQGFPERTWPPKIQRRFRERKPL